MKSLPVAFLLAVAAVTVSGDDIASLTGKWQVHTSANGREDNQTCAFTQKGVELAGSCNGERGTVQISGKVDGKKVTWMYKSEYNGSPLTVSFDGVVNSTDRITGSVKAEEFNVEGVFTATLSK